MYIYKLYKLSDNRVGLSIILNKWFGDERYHAYQIDDISDLKNYEYRRGVVKKLKGYLKDIGGDNG